jgi:hypothetical protein
METIARGKVTGFKPFKGDVDGKSYDTATVFVEADLKGKDSKGYASQPFKCASSAVVNAIRHNEFPLYCELSLETQTDGKAQKGSAEQVCTEIRPISAPVATGGQAPQRKAA